MSRARVVATIGVLTLICLFLATTAGAGPYWTSRYERYGNRVGPVMESGGGHDGGERTPCELTAMAARKACKKDAEDDFYTQSGNCLNISDHEEAAECFEEAREIRAEEMELCRERQDARLEFCSLLEEFRYDPEIDPEDFLSPEEITADPNPYFPLVPGNVWVYENEEEIITVTVTEDTIEILDVTCVVVRDVVAEKADGGDENGEVIEDTLDWYAQDLDGNVWYFGEIAKNFEDGILVDLEGSWTAGEDFAKPGILMPADPYPGMVYRQEFLLREAEDGAQVLSITASVSVPYAECDGDCLQTLEFTPLEPGVGEHKFYLPDLGLILEVGLEEGDRTELVDFTAGTP